MLRFLACSTASLMFPTVVIAGRSISRNAASSVLAFQHVPSSSINTTSTTSNINDPPSLAFIQRISGGDQQRPNHRHFSSMAAPVAETAAESTTAPQQQQYETLSKPAPGTPFHYAFPVHSLHLAKEFYGTVLGCQEGRSSEKWQDYSLHGHQIVCHWAGDDYRCIDYYNPVDGDEVPVPHAGLALTVEQFHALADRLREHGIKFIIEPHLRFQGQPGEQYTMFFKDPSGNNLEFKAMTNHDNLFAKYNVAPH